jgi:hypothetical protein
MQWYHYYKYSAAGLLSPQEVEGLLKGGMGRFAFAKLGDYYVFGPNHPEIIHALVKDGYIWQDIMSVPSVWGYVDTLGGDLQVRIMSGTRMQQNEESGASHLFIVPEVKELLHWN